MNNAPVYRILFAISFVHLLNDTLQSVIPALNPIFAKSYGFSYFELGLIAFALNATASVMQPVVGYLNDLRPFPYGLPAGLSLTMAAMVILAYAESFAAVIIAAVLIGLGSAVFHPEGSRVVALAAGNRRGLAQSIFQVGGNSGQAVAPLLSIFLFIPFGQQAAWATAGLAAVAVIILFMISAWTINRQREMVQLQPSGKSGVAPILFSRKTAAWGLFILMFYTFARSWYYVGIVNYYPLYQIDILGMDMRLSQTYIFVFLAAGALGTFLGGPLSDRYGRKTVILWSMVLSVPLTLALPFCDPLWSMIVLGLTGVILLSSFSVTVVYAQDLLPGKIGTVSGLMIGLAFGLGAIGAVVLGYFADQYGLAAILQAMSFFPVAGLLAFWLPNARRG